jgi:hypothetical protein
MEAGLQLASVWARRDDDPEALANSKALRIHGVRIGGFRGAPQPQIRPSSDRRWSVYDLRASALLVANFEQY